MNIKKLIDEATEGPENLTQLAGLLSTENFADKHPEHALGWIVKNAARLLLFIHKEVPIPQDIADEVYLSCLPEALAEIEKAKAALVFYADIKNWEWNAKETAQENVLDCGYEMQRDFGDLSRQALQSITEFEKKWGKENDNEI